MQKLKFKKRQMRGFSLIEVMVVVVILAILAAIVVPKIMSRPDQAKEVAARQDIKAIETAMDLYKFDNGMYPSTQQGIQALVAKPTASPIPQNWQPGGYLKRLPVDPWGHRYHYADPGQHGAIDIFSYGEDNQPGGKGVNADIGNWNLNARKAV